MHFKPYFTMLVLVCASCAAGAQTIVYVDQANTAGVQNGKGWSTAFTAVQDGIEAAREAFGGEVWVAKGSYGEGRDNAGSLRLRSGVDLYGGFAGTEVVRDQRDPKKNITIIDASVSNNGVPAANAVIGANDTILDGVTIRHGAGLDGAGMSNIAVSPTVINCIFMENVAQRFGGAVINIDGAQPVFKGCTFNKNYAGNSGGAIANTGAAPSVENCTFTANKVGNVGGAIFNVQGGDVFLTGSTFDGNSALEGGGAIFNEGADPSISACKFFRNTTPKFAGAIFNNNGASPLVVNCVFAENDAGDRGGAITTLDSLFTAINCTFVSNTCTNGGSVIFDSNAGTTLFNGILWYNADPPVVGLQSSSEDIRYSNVGGGLSGTGNIALEPQFKDATKDDYSLKPTSPSIDAGTTSGAPSTDIVGVKRPTGAGVDQGAYESDVVLNPPDTFSCPVTLSLGRPGPPAPGNMLILSAMTLTLLAAHLRQRRAQ